MNDEMFRNVMKNAFIAHLQMQTIKAKVSEEFQEMFNGTNERRRYLEHYPNIQTDVTDKDMLLLQIDMALDAGDVDGFMLLTNEMKGMWLLV